VRCGGFSEPRVLSLGPHLLFIALCDGAHQPRLGLGPRSGREVKGPVGPTANWWRSIPSNVSVSHKTWLGCESINIIMFVFVAKFLAYTRFCHDKIFWGIALSLYNGDWGVSIYMLRRYKVPDCQASLHLNRTRENNYLMILSSS